MLTLLDAITLITSPDLCEIMMNSSLRGHRHASLSSVEHLAPLRSVINLVTSHFIRSLAIYIALLTSLGLCAGCDESTRTKERPAAGEGPEIHFSLFNHPRGAEGELGALPFPFPNDAIFQDDLGISASQTGVRGTFTLREGLLFGDELSSHAGSLAVLGGFPLNPLISLPLSAPIDIDELLTRHQTETSLDDAIYLVCLSPSCVGEVSPLEFAVKPLNLGIFAELNAVAIAQGAPTTEYLSTLSAPVPPHLKAELERYDEGASSSSLVWTDEQQRRGLTMMAPATSLGDESVVLYFRSSVGLKPKTSYAVIVTQALRSERGAVTTSLDAPHLPEHSDVWTQIQPILPQIELTPRDVVLTWRFTTGAPQDVHQVLRQALTTPSRETSTLARRIAPFSPQLSATHTWASVQSIESCERRQGRDCSADPTLMMLPSRGARGLALAWAEVRDQLSNQERSALMKSYDSVEGLVSGELSGWDIRAWRGPPPGDEWRAGDRRWPFWCVIPSQGQWIDRRLEARERRAPFPALIWMGDGAYERLNLLLFAGYFARAGVASCALESTRSRSDEALERQLNFQLGIEWRDAPWDPALVMAMIEREAWSPSDGDRWIINRPINRALGAQQLALWLSDDSTVDPEANANPTDQFSDLKAQLRLAPRSVNPAMKPPETEEHHALMGGLIYGGEGTGASAAAVSAAMDPLAVGLITVDIKANTLHQLASGGGARGARSLLSRSFGPWLKWSVITKGEETQSGWSWADDAYGPRPIEITPEESRDDLPPEYVQLWQPEGISERTLSGRWIALYNERTGQTGPLRRFAGLETPPLTVPSQAGDQLSLHVFSQADAARPALVSAQRVITSTSGWATTPSGEVARVAWRTAQWETALDDPLEVAHLLIKNREGSRGEVRDEVRSLVIAHPRSYSSLLSGSLSFAKSLRIGVEQPSQVALYDLTPHGFLLMTQAYEPQRAWGEPWLDWDDLDQLAESHPPFTRNVQLLLSRPTALGGYHAMRLPWREDDRVGLSLPAVSGQQEEHQSLSNVTINLIGTFMSALHRTGSAEELDVSCLQWLTPHIQACSHFTVTDRDLP